MNVLQKLIGVMGIIFASASAQAYIYESAFYNLGKDYLRQVGRLGTDNLRSLPSGEREKCQSRYERILNDGVIDIRIIIGYFDWTTGSQIYSSGRNYGYSPSIDPGAYRALREIITSRCPGEAEFCEFSADGPYKYSKSVINQGRRYLARVEIVFASVSEYYSANTGRYSSEQQQRSQAALAAFNSALKNADAVFYFGHSRNGGGPDFNPPIFKPGTNKVDYSGYYKPQRPGYRKLISVLSSSDRKPSILGLMSCDSRDHFLSGLKKVAPRMGVISSKDVLKVDGVYTALIGASDAILRGQCQRGFLESIRRTSFNRQYITMDRMFE
ncbi:hypothetical protein [Bdellovibrio sp. HCB337]|uniref:hypothetical protein n=1 Tax=Bdellovibrio sp. HCB337 TaxID=3394358 RepID=UPI0039A70A46